MAAEGLPFPWRLNRNTNSANLELIWERSVELSWTGTDQSGSSFPSPPNRPAEILGHGKYGLLAPVGDDTKLAAAIDSTLNTAPDRATLRARGATFYVDRAANKYLEAMFGTHAGHGRFMSLIPGHELVMAKRDPRPASGW